MEWGFVTTGTFLFFHEGTNYEQNPLGDRTKTRTAAPAGTGGYGITPKRLPDRIEAESSMSVWRFTSSPHEFLGFALGKGKKGVYIRVYAKSLKKAKDKLKELTYRSSGRNVRKVMENVKIYIRGWLGYFGIASMKTTMREWDEWQRRRFRMYIWKQWKNPKTRVKNLTILGMPRWQAHRNENSQKGYWAVTGSGILTHTITNKRLAQAGYFSILDWYESLHLCD